MSDKKPILFHDVYTEYKAAQQNIIDTHISDREQYNNALESSIEDIIGIAEAWKANAFKDETELTQDIKNFLEEFAANILKQTRSNASTFDFNANPYTSTHTDVPDKTTP